MLCWNYQGCPRQTEASSSLFSTQKKKLPSWESLTLSGKMRLYVRKWYSSIPTALTEFTHELYWSVRHTLMTLKLHSAICKVTQGPAEVTPAWVWLVGNNMGVITYSFNLRISPKMSHGVLECDIVMLQNGILMPL